jgi:hypothetical protein
MGRKNLGGSSILKPNHGNDEYNDTLENVFDTAMKNLDQKHKKKRNFGRGKIPNLLSLCFKSAADDVIDTSTSHKMHANATEPYRPDANNSDLMGSSSPPMLDDEGAVFLMKDGSMGQAGDYQAQSRRGVIRSTFGRVTHAVQRRIASTGRASEAYDIY